jgi:hypothetical protein
VNGFFSALGKIEEHKSHVLDVGILRYPDLDNPYFKVYRIELEARSTCYRGLALERNSNGISGSKSCLVRI